MFDTLAVAQQLAAGGVEGRGVNPGDPGSSPPARPCAAPLNEGRGEPAPTRGPWKNGPGPPNLVEELQRWLTTTGGGEVMDQPPRSQAAIRFEPPDHTRARLVACVQRAVGGTSMSPMLCWWMKSTQSSGPAQRSLWNCPPG